MYLRGLTTVMGIVMAFSEGGPVEAGALSRVNGLGPALLAAFRSEPPLPCHAAFEDPPERVQGEEPFDQRNFSTSEQANQAAACIISTRTTASPRTDS